MSARSVVVLRLALAVPLAVLLASCVSLPDSSSVHTDSGAGVHQALGPIRSSPRGPQEGDSREEVLAGYLGAMLAFPSDPTIVREFMTPDAARTWDPDVMVQVYEDPTVIPGDPIMLKPKWLGSLDARGSWTSTTGTAAVNALPIPMIRVGHQWRIAHPVPGTLINTEHFNRYYHQFALYFFDPTYASTAPDPVYLKTATPERTGTFLVQDLLKGPTDSMGGVARSAAPPDVRLVAPVAISEQGSATVSLSDDEASLDGNALSFLAKQLAWTLRQERVGVKDLSIKVNGQIQSVQGRGTSFSVGAFHDPTLNGDRKTLYAVDGKGRLVTVTPDGIAHLIQGPVAEPIAGQTIKARSAAVNPSDSSAALVSTDGRRVVWGPLAAGVSDNPDLTFHRDGNNLLQPSWDPFGLLWLVDKVDGRASLSVTNGTKPPTPVPAIGIEGLDVTAFAVSRDGLRLAAVIGRGPESRLAVGMIKRPSSARHLTDLRVVKLVTIVNSDFPLTDIRGLTWVNATTVAVLAKDSGSDAQPFQVSIDGSRVSALPGILPLPPVSIAAGPSSGASLVIGTRAGLYVRTSNQWGQLGPNDLTAPAYPS